MVKFFIDDNGVYINKEDSKEFFDNLMTVKEVANIIINNSRFTYKDIHRKALHDFLNDANRRVLRDIETETFADMKVGYGIVTYGNFETNVSPIIMWSDDMGNVCFATVEKNSIQKIDVTNGDIYAKTWREAERFRISNGCSDFSGLDEDELTELLDENEAELDELYAEDKAIVSDIDQLQKKLNDLSSKRNEIVKCIGNVNRDISLIKIMLGNKGNNK